MQEEPAGRELLDEAELLMKADKYTLDLAHTIRESRTGAPLMREGASVKGFTCLLRYCIVELAALCSLLNHTQRNSLVHAVNIVKYEILSFRRVFELARATLRHLDRMHSFLEDLPKMDFAAASISSAERLSKLDELLTLQHVALTQMRDGVRTLAAHCQKGETAESEVAWDCMGGMHKTAGARRDQIFRDPMLSKWLRDIQLKTPHFGLVSVAAIRNITSTPPMSYQEHLNELLSTPLGLRQQQSGRQLLAQPGTRRGTWRQGNSQSAKARSEQVGRRPIYYTDMNLSEANMLKSAELPGVVAPAGWVLQRSKGPGMPASSGTFKAVGDMGTTDIAWAGSQSATSSSSQVSAVSKPWDLGTTGKRFWTPQAPPHQVSGHLQAHQIDFTHPNAERQRPSASGSVVVPSTRQMPHSRQPLGSAVWSDGASKARTKSDTSGGAWPATPAKQGIWPTAQPYAAVQFPGGVPGSSNILPSQGPTGGQAVLQPALLGHGMRIDPSAANATGELPRTQSRIFPQEHSKPETRYLPFKGVAVGEPVEGINPAPAALVAGTLFSPAFADFIKAVPSFGESDGEATGK
ncbi:hypothetical protein EBH_0039400 [Eimeria brunetti]|uniref:Uncharacterized protein n=1 Tax=Eimeria brunetti TaxID=51314 RepID=U6LRB7_9EIME|nr:hypothetical protein EBH_0039400 [Eimeria brunetti]